MNFLSDPALERELFENGKLVVMKKGDVIVREGQYVKFLPIVLKGSIRVFQQKNDREILLYYVRKQETCTMSLAAAYFNNKSTSCGVAVEATEMLVFPSSYITKWQSQYPSWNKYVMRMFRSRYDELIHSLERIAFEHIDVRVMQYLKEKCFENNNDIVTISHELLSRELGTTRVVISRILKLFEKQKKIKLFRGNIQLLMGAAHDDDII
ncbi:MAG: Crp/Fnr family transcriptional regulator [Ferruginibacter sp.]